MRITTGQHAKTVTMWDFSWLERRAGRRRSGLGRRHEGVDRARLRAVRIDAYSHLIAVDGKPGRYGRRGTSRCGWRSPDGKVTVDGLEPSGTALTEGVLAARVTSYQG